MFVGRNNWIASYKFPVGKRGYVIRLIALSTIAALLFTLPGCKTALSTERVAEISRALIESSESQFVISTITNLDSPVIEIGGLPLWIQKSREANGLDNPKDLKAWKVTYHTTWDGLLGPMVMYFDRYTGDALGSEFRD